MNYYIDDTKLTLEALRKRLEATDLIPSQAPLLDSIRANMAALKKAGVKSVGDLRARLKNTANARELAQASGVASDYLTLLRRALGGFFPKPPALTEFNWLDKKLIARLKEAGIKNARELHEAKPSALARELGVPAKELKEIRALADLSRIQWVSPTFARVLTAAGFPGAAKVAAADADNLYEKIVRANEGSRFYKGKIGLRDIKRLIAAASYVPSK